MVASLFGAILSLTANAASADEPLKLPDSQLEPAKWTEVAGWTADDHLAAFAAYQTGSKRCAKHAKPMAASPWPGHCGTSAAKPQASGRSIRIPLAPFSNRIFNPCASRAWAKHGVS